RATWSGWGLNWLPSGNRIPPSAPAARTPFDVGPAEPQAVASTPRTTASAHMRTARLGTHPNVRAGKQHSRLVRLQETGETAPASAVGIEKNPGRVERAGFRMPGMPGEMAC